MPRTMPRSVMVRTGISGSGTVSSTAMIAVSSNVFSATPTMMGPSTPVRARARWRRSEDAPANLVELDALEERLEIAFAEALVALALDDLEEDRPDHVLGEDLEQQALSFGRRAVHQDAAFLELRDALLMPLDA